MPMVPNDYQKLVLDDISAYEGFSHPVKASWFERKFRRSVPIQMLHPNPGDEFANREIGPNYGIVSRYVEEIGKALKQKDFINFDEPLCVEKMSVGGYMLLDGHHRWLAAHRTGLKTLPVEIMNVTPVCEILSKINASDRRMCVSFDLDEVLLTDGVRCTADRPIPKVYQSFMTKAMLRKNAPLLINQLQAMGFDVWVYTCNFNTESELKRFFRFHRVKLDGLVNGLRNKENRATLRKAFAEKYAVSLHIDNTGIICVNTCTKEYDTYDLNAHDVDWASKALQTVRKIDIVKTHLPDEHQHGREG